MSKLTNLQCFYIEDNQMDTIPNQILERGSDEVLQYIRNNKRFKNLFIIFPNHQNLKANSNNNNKSSNSTQTGNYNSNKKNSNSSGSGRSSSGSGNNNNSNSNNNNSNETKNFNLDRIGSLRHIPSLDTKFMIMGNDDPLSNMILEEEKGNEILDETKGPIVVKSEIEVPISIPSLKPSVSLRSLLSVESKLSFSEFELKMEDPLPRFVPPPEFFTSEEEKLDNVIGNENNVPKIKKEKEMKQKN
eukprot:Anaeramoba_flamelloidesc34264_g1_i3.p1 GENE.c34264_g1_i3~~c34264_g1_i3.p1  ORF type:complete len:269 (+),score=67.02 c34264_g1_i3:73-807(+)